MANVKAGNTYYIDTTGTLSDLSNTVIKGVIVQATSANGSLVIQDSNSQNKLDLKVPTANDTKVFDFSDMAVGINNGLKVTVTNSISTLILGKVGG